jgi:hypothetical protein
MSNFEIFYYAIGVLLGAGVIILAGLVVKKQLKERNPYFD